MHAPIVTSVPSGTTSVTLAPATPGRKGVSITNTDANALYVKLGKSFTVEGSSNMTVKDSDTAATEGVAVYVHIDEFNDVRQANYGHLEFVSPTNVDGTGTVKSGGVGIQIRDSDGAANGYALHILAAQGGFESNMPGTYPTFIRLGNPLVATTKMIRVSNLSAASSAPAVYFDEDASNTYERLRAVVVDNMDETVLLYNFIETASASDYTVKLATDQLYEVPDEWDASTIISGVWAGDGSGVALVTEVF